MVARDTSSEAHAAPLEVFSRLGPERRFELAFSWSERMREFAVEGFRARDPALSRGAARRVLWRRLRGDELFRAALSGAAAPSE